MPAVFLYFILLLSQGLLTFLSFIYFCVTEVCTQGFVLVRQALYGLSHVSSPFCSGYFGDTLLLFAQAGLLF
jgi:hypothetical protein